MIFYLDKIRQHICSELARFSSYVENRGGPSYSNKDVEKIDQLLFVLNNNLTHDNLKPITKIYNGGTKKVSKT